MIDLRSDTVTQPTAAMREAMLAAPVGDDVFGDDPTVNALQERIAQITGKEAALFMPSGTQSNLCALMAHCERGDEYIVGQNAHTYRYEGGGAAVLGSIQPQPLVQDAQGRMQLADVEAAIKPDDPHFARTRLLCLENTWNGHPMPAAYLDDMTALDAFKVGLVQCVALIPGMNHVMRITPAPWNEQLASYDDPQLPLARALGEKILSFIHSSAEENGR